MLRGEHCGLVVGTPVYKHICSVVVCVCVCMHSGIMA